MSGLAKITNATKAQIIAVVNAVFGVVVVFGVGLTDPQLGAIGIAVNAILGLFVAVTYTQSSMRLKHPRDKPVAK